MSNADERLEFTDNWVGVLPKGWTQTPLKYLVKYNSEVLPENTEPHYEFFYAEISDVHFSSGITLAEKIRFEDAPSRARRVVRHNDVLISTVRTYLRAIAQAPHIEDLVGSTGFCVLRSDMTTIEPRYLFYSVVSDFFVERVISQSEGVSYPAINPTTLVGLKTVVPPLKEQRLISRYLDKKTQQIDTLIEKVEKKIELLKEQRTSLINRYVTKGLDPNVEMKDSGVEWIGKIPKHWEVTKLKRITKKIGSGVTPKGGSDVYSDSGVPFLRSQNVHFDGLHLDDVVFISEEIDESMSGTRVRRNDILFNITGGSIGRCCLTETDITMNVNQHVCIVRPSDEISPRFLVSVLASFVGQEQVSFNLTGSGREGLNFENLGDFRIPLPNGNEQVLIGEKISQLRKRHFDLERLLQRQINKYTEYRQSLISSVVTGKVRVTEDMV